MRNKNKKTLLFTFDYELFLKQSGTLEHCLLDPTKMLQQTLNKYNIKVTFFVDILYYYRLINDVNLKGDANKIKEQLQDLVRDGHRLELHLHPHWLDAIYKDNEWIFTDFSNYQLQNLPEEKIEQLFNLGIKLIEELCNPILPGYKVKAFRAGGLCIIPFSPLYNVLKKNKIFIDSSIAKGLKADDIYHNYNFFNAPDKEIYHFDENPLKENILGDFIEIPISVYRKTLYDKLKEKLFYKIKYPTITLYSSGEGETLSPMVEKKNNSILSFIDKLLSYNMPYSLDYVYPDFIVSKIKKSKKSIINLLSHNKFLSDSSLSTIEKLAKKKYIFSTIERLIEKRIEKKDLLLITGVYPYDVYEGYLEEEILFLSEQFNKIYIISQNIKSPITRPLPSNCISFRMSSEVNKKEIIYNIIYILSSPEFYSALYNAIFRYKRFPGKLIIGDIAHLITAGRKIFKFISILITNQNIRTDNLVGYSYWFDKGAYSLSKLKKKNKLHIAISRAHSYDIYFWRHKSNYIPLKYYIYKNLDFVYFISEHGKNYFAQIVKISDRFDNKIKLSRLGTIYYNKQNNKSIIDKNQSFILLSCSHIIELKRIDRIINALSYLEDIAIKWIHIGHNWQQSNYEIEIYEMAKKLLSQKNNIKYTFTGQMTKEQVISFYCENHIDLFINVSETEGLPVSIMEAMSFSIPVIATAVGGTPEIVNQNNGYLLPAHPDYKQIASAIRILLSKDKNEYEQLKLNAYNTWNNLYNAKKNYSDFAKEISRI